MRFTPALLACTALATALATALTACGSSDADDAADDTAATEAPAAAGEEAAPAEEGTAEATPEDAASATPAPTASPSATPSASAAPAAAAAPAAPPQAFTTCAVCHSVQRGQDGIGPSLAGVVGRRAGTLPGHSFSPAMQGAGLTWTEANLRRYLADPNAVVPGTLMPPPGLSAAQVNEVVNYLKTL